MVDKEGNLTGLITIKDIEKQIKYPLAAKDSQGRLLCGAAVGITANVLDRVAALVEKHVDCIVLDSAHGHSANVLRCVKMIREAYPDLQIIAGNVATAEGTEALIKAGADCVKIGIGPGSICTTRVVAGIGVPQMTAIMNAYEAAKKYDVPIIADGGIKYSGDMTKALAAGASVCMMEVSLQDVTKALEHSSCSKDVNIKFIVEWDLLQQWRMVVKTAISRQMLRSLFQKV